MAHSPSKTCSCKSLSCSPFLTKGSHGVLKIHLNPWRFLTYQSQEEHFKKLWGWKEGSMVKSTSCFSRGPNFGPQSPYQVAPAAIPSFPRALSASISATLKRILQEQQTRHLSLESQSPFALASSLYGLSNHLSSFIPHLSFLPTFLLSPFFTALTTSLCGIKVSFQFKSEFIVFSKSEINPFDIGPTERILKSR